MVDVVDAAEAAVMPTFGGKVVVVTGGSRGLGRAMALGFAAAGADVVVSSRKTAACEEVAGGIRALGRQAVAVGCHVGDWHGCEQLVSATLEHFGRIDVLVNNAGIAPVAPSLDQVSEELFDKTVAVNLKGPLRLMSLAAQHMPSGSAIINISSKASVRPTPMTLVYAGAKAGLNAVTKAVSQELGPRGIRVNAIVCGTFHTDSFGKVIPTPDAKARVASTISLRRVADAEEIVGTALFLASDASAYMTGSLIELDGGLA
jgi:NAD(P)-dependent dehydrogenase (short-subunit alcohol dehydrogenase family)